MPFGQNTTAVLAIVAAIIITTVANNIINAIRSEEAATQRQTNINATLGAQQEIQNFEVAHRNQTQQILDTLNVGVATQTDTVVENQEKILAKLDELLAVLNQTRN